MFFQNCEFLFARHANALPGDNDLERAVSRNGLLQIENLRGKIGPMNFNRVFASPAMRTQGTAFGIAPFKEREVLPQMLQAKSQHEQNVLDGMHADLDNAPFTDYMAHRDATKLRAFGSEGAEALNKALAGQTFGVKVLVVGHVVYTNIIALNFFYSLEAEKVFARNDLGECEAFMVTTDHLGKPTATVIRQD